MLAEFFVCKKFVAAGEPLPSRLRRVYTYRASGRVRKTLSDKTPGVEYSLRLDTGCL